MIDNQHLHDIIKRFGEARVLVLGDLMLDRFIFGKVERISPEAPVPVVHVTKETAHLGGSANVVANLVALGAGAVPVGLIGDDDAAEDLSSELCRRGVTTDGLLRDEAVQTIQKVRIIAHNQQVVRVDRERAIEMSTEQETRLIERLDALVPDCSAVIVSDYGKHTVTPAILKHLETRREGLLLGIDPKDKNFEHYRGADIVTPNHGEAERLAGFEIQPDNGSLREAARIIFDRLACRRLLITLGEHGMALFRGPDDLIAIPTRAREIYDVSGAGDTVIATYMLAWSVGASAHEAATLANAAAGVVVGKLGTATLDQAELHAAIGGPWAG